MYIYNTLTKKKEKIVKSRNPLRLFVCGITVNDNAHIGHARTYLIFDSFARYLRSRKWNVSYLQNITDVDDKIISRAKTEVEHPLLLAKKYIHTFHRDMRDLNITSVTRYAPATQYISDIIHQIMILLKKGYAYLIIDQGYYFDIARCAEYGKLSGRTVTQAEDAVSRIDENILKRNRGDFALWKFVNVAGTSQKELRKKYVIVDGEPAWRTELGWGRPGWHIEDTAITEHFFGPQYDIHGGGQDLIFPHHEAEIAQQESASGKKPFVKIWMHTGLIRIRGEKMSKSLHNFITIREFLALHHARVLRWMILMHHYRSPMNYTDELVHQSKESLATLISFRDRLNFLTTHTTKKSSPLLGVKTILEKTSTTFHHALEDDFNTPEACATLFSMINEFQKIFWDLSIKDVRTIMTFFTKSLESIGIILPPMKKIPNAIISYSIQRELYRARQQFTHADTLRKKIYALGYALEDTPRGPFLYRLHEKSSL